ncbi:hypothetical protein HY498_02850 [Candidatus Woesearchaeota archaeon]|nr:hypothetical protein [Candidatus Woesearchaeota archaeon]
MESFEIYFEKHFKNDGYFLLDMGIFLDKDLKRKLKQGIFCDRIEYGNAINSKLENSLAFTSITEGYLNYSYNCCSYFIGSRSDPPFNIVSTIIVPSLVDRLFHYSIEKGNTDCHTITIARGEKNDVLKVERLFDKLRTEGIIKLE